jgi:hypothetical protein
MGSPAHVGKNNHFSFELSWSNKDGFYDLVNEMWLTCGTGSSPIETWQLKVRQLRKFLRGWARNQAGVYKKKEKYLKGSLMN